METMTVYLLDPDPLVQSTLRNFLGDLGYHVHLFDRYDQLAQTAPADDPAQVILLDPGPQGKELIRVIAQLHTRFPLAHLVPMTHRGATLSLDQALTHGVFAYLNKPIRLSELQLLLVRIQESRTGV